MRFSKRFLGFIASSVLILGDANSTEVCFEFGQNDNYTVKYGSNTKSFTNVDDFSRELNNGITGDLFKSTSIERKRW